MNSAERKGRPLKLRRRRQQRQSLSERRDPQGFLKRGWLPGVSSAQPWEVAYSHSWPRPQ